jgi:hypothetical protein
VPRIRMDVDAVLTSVQERDKWRHRLGLLKQSLVEVRQKRLRVQSRLKRLEGELRSLADFSDALLQQIPPSPRSHTDGSTNRSLFAR